MEGDFSKLFISLDKDVQCDLCKKLLNVSPICYSENIGKICGRCTPIVKNSLVRQYCYEVLIKHLTFSCSNKTYGCTTILKWGEVLDHEKTCKHQLSSCPVISMSCKWTGNAKQLTSHIESVHKKLILEPPQFQFSEIKNNETFTLFTHVGNIVVAGVIKHVAEAKYHCILMIPASDMESQCFRYQLELFDETKTSSLILRKNRLFPLGNISENLKSIENMLEVDLDKIKDMLGHPISVIGKFGIVKKTKKEIQQIVGDTECEILTSPNASNKTPDLPDETMLMFLECPVCNEYMRPPIYVCQTGHSICSDCKSKLGNCPTCRIAYTGARNFALENITGKVKYPCRNREIGCSFVSTLEKIKPHELVCELSETHCILGCGWTGLCPSMYYHILERHPPFLIAHDELIVHEIKNNTSHHVVYIMGDLFRLSLKLNSSTSFEFNMQHLGMVDGEPLFKYQLEFIDQSPLGLNMSFTNACQAMTPSRSDSFKHGVIVPYKLLKAYIFDRKFVHLKLNIKKI